MPSARGAFWLLARVRRRAAQARAHPLESSEGIETLRDRLPGLRSALREQLPLALGGRAVPCEKALSLGPCIAHDIDGSARRSAASRAIAHPMPYFVAMTAPAHHIEYSRADYLALEASSNVKHEYLDGQIYGMAGGTPEHAALAAAVIGLLFGQLRLGRCRVHDSDLRVRVLDTGLATYPDVTVVCGPRALDPEDADAVTNPSLIVEVLSKSTEGYDRGDKFEHYKRIPTLAQYVLVSHRQREIEVWTRDANANDVWTRELHGDGARATLSRIGATLDVRELYESAAPAGA